MKITCQSCQSKYNVADEKVQGKIVKIRCRKCSATIVVNGTGAETNGVGDSGGGAGAVGAGEAQWHVNVSDSDQRTLTMPELVDAYNAGVVTQDTFIWTDGMDDWKPLSEVETVVLALNASAGQLAVGTPGAFETPGAAGYEGYGEQQQQPAYAAPAPAYEPPVPVAAASAPAAEPKRAAVQKREARGRDLFASRVPEGEEVQTSAPTGGMGSMGSHGMAGAGLGSAGSNGSLSEGPTGQRNETSVLFSLAVLTKSADDRAPQGAPATTKDDSGLIDLKALATKTDLSAGAAHPEVFGAPIGGSIPPLGAPLGALSVAPEGEQKSKLPLIIGGAGAMVVLLVVGVVLGIKLGSSSAAPAASTLPMASAAPTTSVAADTTGTPSATASAEPTPSATPSATVAAAKPAAPKPGGYRPAPGGPAAAPAGPKPPGAAPAAPAAAPKKGGDCGCNGDLMCLMKCSTH